MPAAKHGTHKTSLPRTLGCPECGGRMNHSGRGRAPGSAFYFCAACPASKQGKELWLGRVIRTGAKGFGFLSLDGLPAVDAVHFRHLDVVSPTGSADPLQRDDRVLVLLATDPQRARRVWKLRRPESNGRANTNGQGDRHRGIITRVVDPAYGFLTEIGSGEDYFVHCSQLAEGIRWEAGEKVTFRPVRTVKGTQAHEVRRET